MSVLKLFRPLSLSIGLRYAFASSNHRFATFIALLSMNDSNISFITRSWVNAPDYWPVKFDLNKKIYETLPQNGIHFAYPQLNVTIKN